MTRRSTSESLVDGKPRNILGKVLVGSMPYSKGWRWCERCCPSVETNHASVKSTPPKTLQPYDTVLARRGHRRLISSSGTSSSVMHGNEKAEGP